MVWNEPKFNLVTKVHVTGTSALNITVARTPQIPGVVIKQGMRNEEMSNMK